MSIYHLYKGKDENDGLDLEQQKQNISYVTDYESYNWKT